MRPIVSKLPDVSSDNKEASTVKEEIGIQSIVDEARRRGIPVQSIP